MPLPIDCSRRQFLQATASALTFPWHSPPKAPVGFAVVGLGGLTQTQILPDFARCRRARLHALVSGSPAKAQRLAQQYGVASARIYGYRDMAQLADDPGVEAVYIVLPNALHAEYAVAAMRAGKHVLCEKPMATSVRDAEAMVQVAAETDRKLMVAYRLRSEPLTLHARALCQNHVFGRLRTATFTAHQPMWPSDDRSGRPWRLDRGLAGGGVLVDTGIYPLNTARFLLGEEPSEVQGMCHASPNDPRFDAVEELCHVQLRFPSGALVSCASSYASPEINGYRMVGETGWFGVEHGMLFDAQRFESSDAKAIEAAPAPLHRQIQAELETFAWCIQSNEQPASDGWQGLQDMRLMRGIYASAGLDRLA